MITPHTQVADLLDDAADVIERDGWCQNDLGTPDGRVCAMGALAKASGMFDAEVLWWDWDNGTPEQQALLHAARGALHRWLGNDLIPAWNDRPTRTQQEVLDAFRLVAKQQRRLADDLDGGVA